jgi:mRNA-degrading endonuclease RelE of RelBE toxin-antitoxin system
MSYEIEISKKAFKKLEEISDIDGTTVSALVDEILQGWLKKNYKAIMEDDEEENGELEDDDDILED